MYEINQFIANHWKWAPLLIMLLANLVMICRKDRGAIFLKKRTEIPPNERKTYYLFHFLYA